jgi:hypothetical protein
LAFQKPFGALNGDRGDDHVTDDREGRDEAQEADDHQHSTDDLGQRHDPRPEEAGFEAEACLEAGGRLIDAAATEITQLLQAVAQDDCADRDTQNGQAEIGVHAHDRLWSPRSPIPFFITVRACCRSLGLPAISFPPLVAAA